jgi:ribose/xylose/arabinose/galactoside ABC-type transport system permease subunit
VGSIPGTLLGVAAIAVLKNGLASLPVVIRMNGAEELSGMLTGALLLVALTGSVLPKFLSSWRAHRHAVASPPAPSPQTQ